MAELYQLDYGYKVKVLNGKNKNKEGYLVYCSCFGDVCIDTKKRPDGNLLHRGSGFAASRLARRRALPPVRHSYRRGGRT